MYDFPWNSKPDKVSRKRIITEYQKGGFKMIDINMFPNALKGRWIKIIMDDKNNGQWK